MNATALAYAFIGGILPSLIWLAFWLREDNLHESPRLSILFTFLLGMLSVALAVYAENVVQTFVADQTTKYILWAVIEECSKALAVAAIVFFKNPIEEPVDCMIFFITAALGFSAVENSLFLIDPLQSGNLAASIATGDFRFIGATLVHTVSSGIIGFCFGLVYYRGFWAKIPMFILGLIGASAVHSAFNLSVIAAPPGQTLSTFAWIWCAVIVLLILFEEAKAVKPPPALVST